MRSGSSWTDVYIKNMSTRGLMAEGEAPPSPRSYVEIRRGRQIIIGRVVWSRNGRFGLRSQDRIDIEAVLHEPRLASRPSSSDQQSPATAERRLDPQRRAAERVAAAADRGRRFSGAFQFVVLAGLGALAAALVATAAYDVLSMPLKAAAANLAR